MPLQMLRVSNNHCAPHGKLQSVTLTMEHRLCRGILNKNTLWKLFDWSIQMCTVFYL